jgi:hypothetical protein
LRPFLALGCGWRFWQAARRNRFTATIRANQSVTVSEADSRVEQVVRNELVLGFGGEQPSTVPTSSTYECQLGHSGLLPGGLDNEFSAARATVTATYVLKATSTGETVKSGTRFADAQLDLPSQNFAQETRQARSRNPRSARRWQHLSAPMLPPRCRARAAGLHGRDGTDQIP